MPIITKITPQKSKKRVNLYLDDKFFCGLDLSVALKHSLKVGQELSEEKVAALVNQSRSEELFQKAANFISYRPRSEKEVRDYLFRKNTPEVSRSTPRGWGEKEIKRLKKSGFLNDYDFAKWWINQRLQFRPKGKIALRSELIKKGINKKIIDEALKEVSFESELKAAKKAYEKAIKQLRSVEPKKRKQRLIGRLSSRGFSWEVIKKTMETPLQTAR